ncbi:protein Wiz-like isoform X8 [Cyprinus carpio]|uniref:Protein Wiz-like isoform X8 n=1 Tax=Cyprinus carpio TaxID=7962 RepID=A0A9Q9Y4X6_CYPCA|nr:protein Wiz-like isoform X8 [Cyprinus carpio]
MCIVLMHEMIRDEKFVFGSSSPHSIKCQEEIPAMEKTAPDPEKKTNTATVSKECLEAGLDKDLDDSDLGNHSCEFCGSSFESRRGLSSHARYHLRQLGVAVSDSSGAPIDLLYQLMKERGGTVPKLEKQVSPVKKYKTKSPKLKKKDSGPKLKIQISNLVKKKYALSSSSPIAVKGSAASGRSSLPFAVGKPRKASSKKTIVSTPSSALSLHKDVEFRLSDVSPSTSLSLASAKPLWAPQETDAPLSLETMMNSTVRDDVHVCELCGAWYETRKGLSSHARAHLRQFGVNLDSKVAPIDMLHTFIQSEEFKEKASAGQQEGSGFEEYTSPSSTPSTLSAISKNPPLAPLSFNGLTSIPLTPPSIKKKIISHDFARNLPLSDKVEFKSPPSAEKHKISLDVSGNMSLSGQIELKSSPSELISSPPNKKLKISTDVSEELPFSKKTELKSAPSVKKQKISLDVSASLPLAPKPEKQEPKPFVCCDYCGEMFDTRKALSCHARGHLRQLGVRWSLKVPPIEALYELMRREGTERASQIKSEPSPGAAVQWKKTASSPQTLSLSPGEKEKPASDSMTTGCDATCELCGFDFENRKALASHARAHLRQQGVDWKVIGSPIETLAAWMKSEPWKVAELHKSYMRGHLPLVKKASRRTSTPYTSSDSESVRLGSHKVSSAARDSVARLQVSQFSKATREGKAGMSHSSSSHKKWPLSDELSSNSLIQIPTAHSELNVRSPRGCERRPPKHFSHSESVSGETGPSKPSRAGNIPSLVPRLTETSLVKLVGKMYSLKCRFCEEIFRGPLSIQEDWVMHLQQHILKLKKDSASSSSPQPPLSRSEAPLLIGPQAV